MSEKFNFKFERPSLGRITENQIFEELERVANHFKYQYFRRKDFDSIANIHSATVERHFSGSWSNAINALKKRLKKRNIDFIGTKRNQRNTPEVQMFEEMERIWNQLGHRPSRSEWGSSNPAISYDTIYRNFNGWTNACLKFIEYKTGTKLSEDKIRDNKKNKKKDSLRINSITKNNISTAKRSRSISLNIRIKILSRDNFRCVYCGRSPATHLGAQLHVDHIIPFSKGGSNSVDNLQTLCEECNLGKSNEKIKTI